MTATEDATRCLAQTGLQHGWRGPLTEGERQVQATRAVAFAVLALVERMDALGVTLAWPERRG